MACCGFTLKSCTNCAVAFTLINFIFFVVLDILLLICLKFPSVFGSTSQGLESFLLGFKTFNSQVLLSLIVIRLILRLLWLVSAPILFIGNRIEKQSFFNSWILIGLCITFFITVTSAYFLISHYKCDFLGDIVEWIKNLSSSSPEKWAGEEAARFVVFLALFDFGLLFFIPMIILITLVHRRGIQIKYKKREDRLIDTWSYELTPYRIPRVRLNEETNRNGVSSSPLPAPPSVSQVQERSNTNAHHSDIITSSPGANPHLHLIGSTPSSTRERGRHRHRHRHHKSNYPHHTYHSRQRPATTADIPSVSGYLGQQPRRSSSTGHLLHESSATIYFEPNPRSRGTVIPIHTNSGYDNHQTFTDDTGKIVKSTSFLTADHLNEQQHYSSGQQQAPRSPGVSSFTSPHQYNQNAIYSQSVCEQSNHLQPVEDRFSKRRTSSLEAALI